MKQPRRGLLSFLTDLAIRFAGGRRRPEEQRKEIERRDFRTDTSGMGVGMTSFLRDRLRRQWLRIRRGG